MPDPSLDIDSFIAGLPKVELHVHLVGSASVPTVIELARRHPDCGVPTDAAELRRFYEFTDFAHFIRVYIAVNALIRTPDDLRALTYGTARDLASQNVRYAEVTVTPDSHLLMGIKPEAIGPALTEARSQARTDFGIELGWIFDIPGELGLESGSGPPTGLSASRRRAVSASGSVGQRSESPGPSSPTCSDARVPSDWPAFRTPVRQRARRRSGSRSACSLPSGSAMASPRCRIPTWCRTWPHTTSRSTCARRQIFGPGR